MKKGIINNTHLKIQRIEKDNKMRKIKVIQLVQDLEIGGREKIIAEITRKLDRDRYDIETWCIAGGGEIAENLKKTGEVVRILNILTYRNPFNILKLSGMLKKVKPDIVHTHGYFASTIGRIAAKFAGIKIIIYHVHSTYFDYKKRHLLTERFLSFFTQKIICCSKAVEAFVRGHERINPSKTVVIYNGVNEDEFRQPIDIAEIKRKLNISPGGHIIGIVASLNRNKGHKYLFKAAVKILKEFSDVKFLIVGDGILKKELEKSVQEMGIAESIIFTGTRCNIPEILSVIDIFVLPTCKREGLGIAIIEAMAAGKPVVASDIGGIPELVKNGVSGILAEPGNSDALSAAIMTLLNDKARVKNMGRKGAEIIKQSFSSVRMIKKIEKLYQELL